MTANGTAVAPRSLRQPPWTLKYLFAAQFLDGTRIEQTHADVSESDPNRSRYFDVAQRVEAGNPLAFFGLTDGKNFYVVDLRDGHFEINGLVFHPQPVAAPVIPEGGAFELIFQRDHRQDIVYGPEVASMGDHFLSYRFGWRYTVAGRSWEQTIVVV